MLIVVEIYQNDKLIHIFTTEKYHNKILFIHAWNSAMGVEVKIAGMNGKFFEFEEKIFIKDQRIETYSLDEWLVKSKIEGKS